MRACKEIKDFKLNWACKEIKDFKLNWACKEIKDFKLRACIEIKVECTSLSLTLTQYRETPQIKPPLFQ